MNARILTLEGIHNFRDYGGYAASGAARVKSAVLWRSAQHCNATAADLAEVARLGLRTVIDLRGDSEREAYPCARPDDFAAAVLFAAGETAGLHGAALHEEAAFEVRTAADAQAAMTGLYRGMAWRPVLVGSLRIYLEALAEREGPSLLHCFAGKDRTGLAAALAHHILGVHPDDAMADYLLTDVAGDPLMRSGGAGTTGKRPGRMDEDALRTLWSVHPDYLTAAFGAIRERHGSLDAYLEDVLGAGSERRAAIRANLLE